MSQTQQAFKPDLYDLMYQYSLDFYWDLAQHILWTDSSWEKENLTQNVAKFKGA